MLQDDILTAIEQVALHDDPGAELTRWLGEQRALNIEAGGNDRRFVSAVIYAVLTIVRPAAAGGQK